MPRKYSYEDDYDYEEDMYEDTRKSLKKLRREPDKIDRKKWERERQFDRDHDYDERR